MSKPNLEENPYPPDKWGYSRYPFTDIAARQAQWDSLTTQEKSLAKKAAISHVDRTYPWKKAKALNPKWERFENFLWRISDTRHHFEEAAAAAARNFNLYLALREKDNESNG